jgi:hemerythrin-like domain-containing protein
VLLGEVEQCCQQMSGRETATRSQLVQLAEATAILLDEVHFDKEEQILLPLLVRNGCDWESESLRRTLDEHVRERHLLETLRHAVATPGRWREPVCRSIVETASELVESQSNLVAQKRSGLYAMAVERLDEADATQLEARLEAFDAGFDQARGRAARRLVDHVLERRRRPRKKLKRARGGDAAPASVRPGG